jgi:malonate decarboxylase delta subunit
MERVAITFKSGNHLGLSAQPKVCGVASSGNLEVLVEEGEQTDTCKIEVNTPAEGFREIWNAVLNDFVERQPVGGLRFTINDAGATPAVVSLRLDQAIDIFRSGNP